MSVSSLESRDKYASSHLISPVTNAEMLQKLLLLKWLSKGSIVSG